MRVVVVTGVSELAPIEEKWVASDISARLAGADVIVTGGAKGVDTIALMEGVVAAPGAQHDLCVPRAPWNLALLSWIDQLNGVRVRVRRASPGKTRSEAYMNRNSLMIGAAIHRAGGNLEDVEVLAYPRTERELLRSGTWATIRRVKKAGIRMTLIPMERE